jgi:predicted transcriptional regulator
MKPRRKGRWIMTEPKKRGRPRSPGVIPTRQTLMIEPMLYDQVERLARRRGSTRSDVVNQALREFIERQLLETEESQVAGRVAHAVEDGLERVNQRWSTLLVRNGMEALRLQYVLFNFLNEAGIPPSKIEKWREQGWNYAVQEYRRKPQHTLDEEDD